MLFIKSELIRNLYGPGPMVWHVTCGLIAKFNHHIVKVYNLQVFLSLSKIKHSSETIQVQEDAKESIKTPNSLLC